MDKSCIDISLLDEKVTFFIEPFEWINPQNVFGFSKDEVRKENIRLYEESNFQDNDSDMADIIIAAYLQECLLSDPNGYLIFLDYGLWLITELYSSYVTYTFPADIRKHLLTHPNKLNYVFERIYELFSKKDKEEDYHCANLLKIFIFEVFQFGSEWGVFDTKHINHDSVFSKNTLIDENTRNEFLCSHLNKENIEKLSDLIDYKKGNIPQYKY